MSSDAPLSFNQIANGIAEFIEVAVHTILYLRQVYPPDIFIRRKKYSTPVFQSRHPALNEYISNAVGAAAEQLFLGNLDKVIVVIKTKQDVALERFVFAVRNMLDVETYNRETPVEGAITAPLLGQFFRSFLVKLSMAESQLGHLRLGDGISFAILIELEGGKTPSAAQSDGPPPWVPALPQQATAGVSDKAELYLVRAVDTGIINLSLMIQESGHKRVAGEYDPVAAASGLKLAPTKADTANDPEPGGV